MSALADDDFIGNVAPPRSSPVGWARPQSRSPIASFSSPDSALPRRPSASELQDDSPLPPSPPLSSPPAGTGNENIDEQRFEAWPEGGSGEDHSSPTRPCDEVAPREPLHQAEEKEQPQSTLLNPPSSSSESSSSTPSSIMNAHQNRDSMTGTSEVETGEGIAGGAVGGVPGGEEINEARTVMDEKSKALGYRSALKIKTRPSEDFNAEIDAEKMAAGNESDGGEKTKHTPRRVSYAGESHAPRRRRDGSVVSSSGYGQDRGWTSRFTSRSTSASRTGGGKGSSMRPSASNGHIARSLLTRYSIGEYVLISREICEDGTIDVDNMLNRFGYPPHAGSAGATTPEERRGPYVYVLAMVVSVHFGEDAQYYTVRREDTMQDQRADAEWMEPITSEAGLGAAKIAARMRHSNSSRGLAAMIHARGGLRSWGRSVGDADVARRLALWVKMMHQKAKAQMETCLNGNRPYGISCRFTGVNFLVVCSVWYLYIDQVRLAFMPPSADVPCAIISAIVWIVLFMELIVELFIRPSGYHALIRSEKAFLPSTVRYLNRFHLVTEMISLIFFAPEWFILFGYFDPDFSLANACQMSLYGPGRLQAFYGTSYICMLRLRIFGVVRHWTKMWINNTFVRVRGVNGEWQVQRAKGFFAPQRRRDRGYGQEIIVAAGEAKSQPINDDDRQKKNVVEKKNVFLDEYHLTNASRIGTALFNTNANRVLVFVFFIGLQPLFSVLFEPYGGTNPDLENSAVLLNAYNLALNATDNETCALLEETIQDWIKTYSFESNFFSEKFLSLWCLDVQPKRCGFLFPLPDCPVRNNATEEEGIRLCNALCNIDSWLCSEKCEVFRTNTLYFVTAEQPAIYSLPSGESVSADFAVHVVYNKILSVRLTMMYILALNLGMTLFVLLFLAMFRNDAGRLVLGPLRRMLKIVAFYAKNPLSPPPRKETVNSSHLKPNDAYFYDSDDDTSDMKLGTFETEQLVNTVTIITDLLRKCWGVAGAGIISSNLATKEGGLTAYFNPTVPGKAVYALFAFVNIDRFNFHLHALKGDIMILINDIAAVLHEEVYRWGYEDSGQCNKNLGSAFLMVYKIGSVSEVMEKRERAEAVIFSTRNSAKSRRRKDSILQRSRSGSDASGVRSQTGRDRSTLSLVDNIDLSSLPGMRAFSDRALLGLLKTFAGIHRDKTILSWNNDFRLGAGVGAMSINLLFGMDAGWAVEGAVGSMHKIDATYLSPHVNMASRMMSATKQYGVHFLLSQAVQKLLSENAQRKLRHVDTVTVKGSSVQQKIFTYDARVRSDFFLYSKTKSQEDADSDRYTPAIWNVDQDLVAMRNHICDEFTDIFNRGREEYLLGNWPTAIELLKSANKIMVEQVVNEGYWASKNRDISLLDDDEVEETHLGDGPCQRLIAYMEELGGYAPKDWGGYRPLTSK